MNQDSNFEIYTYNYTAYEHNNMSVIIFFSIFDYLLAYQAASIESQSIRRTMRLQELVTDNEQQFLDYLFHFLCWLVSDNERELFFSRKCEIKFFHYQANNDMLKACRFLKIHAIRDR